MSKITSGKGAHRKAGVMSRGGGFGRFRGTTSYELALELTLEVGNEMVLGGNRGGDFPRMEMGCICKLPTSSR